MIRHAPWAEGPSDFAIALRPIGVPDWFEGGEAPEATVARKTALLSRAPELVWAETAGSAAGQAEALALVEAWAGRAAATDGPSLWRAGLLVADDLCLMESVEGAWTLTALTLCAGSLFNAAEVIGRPLAELHAPVPGFAERLLGRVTRIFDRLPADAVLMRRNWSVLASGELHLPQAAPVRALAADLRPEDGATALHVRVERQSLRRLPETGGLLFSIRIWLHPLAALEGERRGAFARAWREASPAFRAYKGLAALDDAVAALLGGERLADVRLVGENAVQDHG